MGIVIRNSGQGGRVKFTSLGLGGGFNAAISGTTQQQQGGGGGGEGASLLLDTYTDAAAAFSLRKLRTNYNGSAIRVRRTSDNTEQDIGFVNNQLDTSSLQSFVGGTNLLTYSEDFSVWATNLSATINSNVTTDPLGGNTADRLNFGSSANSEVYLQPISWQSTTYNISIYAKSDSTNKFRVKIWNGVTATFSSDITTTSTWTRYNVSLTVNSGVGNFGISNISAGGAGSIFIWGAQISVSSLQPYQVTAGSAITTNRDGFITRWYDQSGNAVNATQTTAGNQPRIISSGNVETQLSKPAIQLLNSPNTSGLITSLTLNNPFSIIGVVSQNDITGGGNRIFQSSTLNSLISIKRSDNLSIFTSTTILTNFPSQVANQTYLISFLRQTGTNYIYQNGSYVGGDLTSTANWGTFTFGGQGTYNEPALAKVSEVIIYSNNQNSNISGIHSNINTHYSIY